MGRLNKQIAFDLGISEITVKLHRGNLMRKMQLSSVGELVRVWEALPAEVRERVEAEVRPVGGPVIRRIAKKSGGWATRVASSLPAQALRH